MEKKLFLLMIDALIVGLSHQDKDKNAMKLYIDWLTCEIKGIVACGVGNT